MLIDQGLGKHFVLSVDLAFISYRPETRGIPQKITLRDEIFRGMKYSEGEARGIFHPAG
jgi:hypothetical protein